MDNGYLLTPERHWVCPNCPATDVTRVAGVHTRYHNCGGLKGLSVPMLPEGVKASVVAFEREDYIGNELVQTDGDGRPVQKVITTRDDGYDCAVYAPTATMAGI